jgi:diguanylate cyclase (GGDEF)-like protein
MRYVDHFLPEFGGGELARLGDRRRARLLVIACHAGAALILVSASLRLLLTGLPSPSWLLAAGFSALGLGATPWVLARTRSLKLAGSVPLVVVAVAVPALAAQGGGLSSPIASMAPAMPIVAAYFVGGRAAAYLAAALGVELCGLALVSKLGLLPGAPAATQSDAVKAALLTAFLGVITFIAHANLKERDEVEQRLDRLARQFYQSSIRDPLTELFNRGYLTAHVERELAYARRHGTDVGVILLDIDHFKSVNDTHGHQAGDEVLVRVSEALRRCLRTEDVVARYGGEEFAVVFRGNDLGSTALAAERLRRAIESLDIVWDDERVCVTVSLGCAARGADEADGFDALFGLADARLYRAKSEGRNRAVASG